MVEAFSSSYEEHACLSISNGSNGDVSSGANGKQDNTSTVHALDVGPRTSGEVATTPVSVSHNDGLILKPYAGDGSEKEDAVEKGELLSSQLPQGDSPNSVDSTVDDRAEIEEAWEYVSSLEASRIEDSVAPQHTIKPPPRRRRRCRENRTIWMCAISVTAFLVGIIVTVAVLLSDKVNSAGNGGPALSRADCEHAERLHLGNVTVVSPTNVSDESMPAFSSSCTDFSVPDTFEVFWFLVTGSSDHPALEIVLCETRHEVSSLFIEVSSGGCEGRICVAPVRRVYSGKCVSHSWLAEAGVDYKIALIDPKEDIPAGFSIEVAGKDQID